MANSITHALGVPIRKARFTVAIPMFDATGTPTDPTSPDTELSIDGAASTDAGEECATISGMAGMNYITLTGAEMDCSVILGQVKNSGGPKVPLFEVRPQDYPILFSGTASAGGATSITLAGMPGIKSLFVGAYVRTTGGTGGGGTGGANNQARLIRAYDVSSVATVSTWETNPDATTTYDILASPLWASRLGLVSGVTGGKAVTGTLAVNDFTSNVTLTNANQVVGRFVIFLTGNAAYAARRIHKYIVSGGEFQVSDLPAAPANGDEFIIV